MLFFPCVSAEFGYLLGFAGSLVGHDLRLRFFQVGETEFDILPGRQPREQRILLENNAAVISRPDDRRAVHGDLAAGGRFQAGNNVQQRSLAAAGGADHADKFVFKDLQVYTVQGNGLLIASLVNLFHIR